MEDWRPEIAGQPALLLAASNGSRAYSPQHSREEVTKVVSLPTLNSNLSSIAVRTQKSQSASPKRTLASTGERVVPGKTEPQVWNEHIARYRYAALFSQGKTVLDVGSGAGYGADILSRTARWVGGFDVSEDAMQFAGDTYPQVRFLCASATNFPVADKSFQVVTALEVIEHLEDWRALLQEAARVLTSDGVFLVSTPNIEYYAESRGPSGPNPYHVHEFDLGEFRAELGRYFPCVQIGIQNQQEALTFAGQEPAALMAAHLPPVKKPEDGHFFLAVCSFRPVSLPAFAVVSSTHNLLRERERHIRGLQRQLHVAQHETQEAVRAHNEVSLVQESLRQELHAAQARLQELEVERERVKNSRWIRLGNALGLGPWRKPPELAKKVREVVRRAKAKAKRVARPAAKFARHYVEAPLELAATATALTVMDLAFSVVGRRRGRIDRAPDTNRASIVIPTWNGKEKLEANLPSVLWAAGRVPGTEVIVVDDGSTDGTADFLAREFPSVRCLHLDRNSGFATACNTGAQAATSEIVVFLNNDMLVEAEFVSALVPHFADPELFAVSGKILLPNRNKLREETGLTEAWWQDGRIVVGHRHDPLVDRAFPCAYPGGGSSAFDRAKFLQLGGFDELFRPFYYEDTDLGYRAWKYGWKVLYEPDCVVYHEHRGTVNKHFSRSFVDVTVGSNAQLYCWKNVHDRRLLARHFATALRQVLATESEEHNGVSYQMVNRNFRRLRHVMRSRWHARSTGLLSDKETLRRSLGGYFRDRFELAGRALPSSLKVLLVSPYPIEPANHGGAVLMKETVRALSSVSEVHVISFVDREDQLDAQKRLLAHCRSALSFVRPRVSLQDQWTLLPNAIREFAVRDFAWVIHRTIFLKRIDVLQLEYTTMGQYAGRYRNIPCILFEHDISAQSLWRRIRSGEHDFQTVLEFVRMRLYEPRMLKRLSRVQVCSNDNARYLQRLIPGRAKRIDCDIRAAVDVGRYQYTTTGREPDSLLFVGSFRHAPNVAALDWFTQEVLPIILKVRPQTRLYVVGSEAPQDRSWHPNVHLIGSVPDIREPLERYSVFVCPVRSGSGIRVKLLEAFASGMPAVSTSIGAEGLISRARPVCEVADDAASFALATLRLLTDQEHARRLSENARELVERSRDSRRSGQRLEALYRNELGRMRGAPVSL